MLGRKFGRWTVVGARIRRGTNSFFRCVCDCGTNKVVSQANLCSGKSESCGCRRAELMTTHGLYKSRTYSIWQNMKRRCKSEPNYAGRGISVCERWQAFSAFLEDMGHPPSKEHSIDRIDNHLGYFRANCRWATDAEQARNTTRSVIVTFRGESMCRLDWARRVGISGPALKKRLSKNSVSVSLTKPKGN